MKNLTNVWIAIVVVITVFLTGSNIYAETTTPTSFKFKVISFALSTDAATCSNPTNVFEVEGDTDAEKLANAQYMDFALSPDLGSNSSLAVGVYECVIMSLSDTIKVTAPAGEAGCNGTEQTQDVNGVEMGGTAAEEIITIYISTAGQNSVISDSFDLTEAMRPFSAPGLLLENQLVVSAGGSSGSFVVIATDTVTDTGPGPCNMDEPRFTFSDIPTSTTAANATSLAGTSLALPDGCVLDGTVSEFNSDSSCTYKGCPPVFEDEAWGHGSYGKDGLTCDMYCLNEICDSYNGQWKQYYCFGSCN